MNTADLIQKNEALAQEICALKSAKLQAEEQYAKLQEKFTELQNRLTWFERQIFGQKSEKQIIDLPEQGSLFERKQPEQNEPEQSANIKAHKRRKKQRSDQHVNATGLRFDESVPTETVEILPPELSGPDADQFEIVGYDTTAKLAMRPGSYVILQQKIAKVRRKCDGKFLPSPAIPGQVIEGSYLDVSALAGFLVEKGCYHMPLHRQWQRITDSGIHLARACLTARTQDTIELMRAVYQAQFESVLQSKVLAMDEVPIKAGRKQKGKMQTTWFWTMYGDQDEVVFTWSQSRGHEHALAQLQDFSGVLLVDGYDAYQKAQKKLNAHQVLVKLANCWTHTRRGFDRALQMEPLLAQQALNQIAKLYQLEAKWRGQELLPEQVYANRQKYSAPIVQEFFAWVDNQLQDAALLPSNPLCKALAYAQKRVDALKVFLTNPFVQLDTNHVERALRCIPMGRKNFMFCWTELGAEHLGIIQSLLVTCRLHGINPYDYLVDVLQRVGSHPASQIADLIPRNWKLKFADNPMRSAINVIDRSRVAEPVTQPETPKQ